MCWSCAADWTVLARQLWWRLWWREQLPTQPVSVAAVAPCRAGGGSSSLNNVTARRVQRVTCTRLRNIRSYVTRGGRHQPATLSPLVVRGGNTLKSMHWFHINKSASFYLIQSIKLHLCRYLDRLGWNLDISYWLCISNTYFSIEGKSVKYTCEMNYVYFNEGGVWKYEVSSSRSWTYLTNNMWYMILYVLVLIAPLYR